MLFKVKETLVKGFRLAVKDMFIAVVFMKEHVPVIEIEQSV